MDEVPAAGKVPEGMEFLHLVWGQEQECERKSDEQLPKLGTKASALLPNIGTALSFLDRFSSCFWECAGGDHVLEYLGGRAGNSARASLRLLRSGLYDEGLVHIRSIGETANLLYLFKLDPAKLPEWKTLDDKKRRQKYSAVNVRIAIEKLKKKPPIDQDRYDLLCGLVTHVTPKTKPGGSYNPFGLPMMGGNFQEVGLVAGLNELGASVSLVTALLASLSSIQREHRQAMKNAADNLAESLGGLSIMELEDFMEENRQLPGFDAAVEALRQLQSQRKKLPDNE